MSYAKWNTSDRGTMKRFKVSTIINGQMFSATSDGTEEGTVFTGPQLFINMAKNNIRRGREVALTASPRYGTVLAGYASPLAITAALCSVDSMRAIIWSAPQEVIDFLSMDHGCSNIRIKDA